MSQDESPYWDSHEQEEVPFYQRPAFRTIASIWAVLFFGMLFVNWLVQSIVKGSQTASIDREVLSALQAAVYEVVKDQKDLVSRVDDQYLDLLSRINDLSTGVRRMGHALREPLSLERLQGIVQVPREENRSTMVFCVVSIVLAVLMHYIVLRKDEGQDMRRIRERCGSPRRCQQAVLQCGVMNPPPAYNPEVVPIAAWRDAPMMPGNARIIPVGSPLATAFCLSYTSSKESCRSGTESRCEGTSAERMCGVHGVDEYPCDRNIPFLSLGVAIPPQVPCGHRCCCGLCHTRLKRYVHTLTPTSQCHLLGARSAT